MKLKVRVAIVWFITLSALSTRAQDLMQRNISGEFTNQTIFEILENLGEQEGITFYYEPQKVPYYRQSFTFKNQELLQVLTELLKGSNLSFIRYQKDAVIITSKSNLNSTFVKSLIEKWENGEYRIPTLEEFKNLSYSFGEANQNSGNPIVLSGVIKDDDTGEVIVGATLFDQNSGLGTLTDEEGKFELELPLGTYELSVQYIGYQSVLIDLGIYESAEIDFTMAVQSLSILEVVVEAERPDENIKNAEVGIETLSQKEMKSLSVFAGEADVIKSLESLAGVSSVGEGSSGINVRGGTVDQNLILQDGALIFNANHALGFFSVFNTDAIQNVTLYKGHIPANYGGRISSVLEVNIKDGDNSEFHGKGGVGIASARVTLEGPLVKGKSSFLVSLRSSYSDWLIREAKAPNVNESSVFFFDGLIKLSQNLPKGKLTLSAYGSDDSFRFAQEFGYGWNTQAYNLEWQHTPTDNFSSQTKISYGTYRSNLFELDGQNGSDLNNGLWNIKAKQDFTYVPNDRHEMVAGFEGIYYDSYPEEVVPQGELTNIIAQRIEKDQAREFAIYANDVFDVNDRLSFAFGLRYSFFQNLGPKTVYEYRENEPLEESNVIASSTIEQGAVAETFGGLEPRFSARFSLNDKSSIKLSYNRLRQYIHLLSNTTAATPVDVWQVSNSFIPPQKAHNYSLGYFQNSADNNWEYAFEVYYRDIEDIIAYKDLAQLLLNDKIETALLSGKGRTYGFEVSTQRKKGKWNGRLSYTYSRSSIKVERPFIAENINDGNWYPANYDQPHQVNLNLKYEASPRGSFNINFTFRSGRPITAPVSSYVLNGVVVTDYSDRNQFRIPAYHRLDLAYTLDNSKSKLKGWRGSWTVSLYNLYARKNPFSVYFQRDERNIQRSYKLSVLGTIFPSLTYNFEF